MRFGADVPKQFLTLAGKSILEHTVNAFIDSPSINDVVVALPHDLVMAPPPYLVNGRKPITVVEGGARRQDSVANAFARIADRADIVVIHDAARPLVSDALIRRAVDAAATHGAAIAAVHSRDTVKRTDRNGTIVATLPREEIYLAQTPQAFRVEVLRAALALTDDVTDEAALAEHAGHPVHVIEGDPRNLKITTPDDLAIAERLMRIAPPPIALRIGNGYDLHRLVSGRPLILGGVTIPYEKGLAGHSDADAVCHAITDALLGAAAAGDIGRHFPDTEESWKDARSTDLLRRAGLIVSEQGWSIVNLDVVVIAQKPKLASYVPAMIACLAATLGIRPAQISVKGKTNEGVDSMGAGESIAVHAVALLSASN